VCLSRYTRGCGCIGHPAFPAPSVRRGTTRLKNSGESGRENEDMCLHVIASQAKQSILSLRGSMDCFVACAPRNHGVIARHTASSSPGLTARSSIPEASVIEPRSRGVLVASFRGGSQSRTRNLEIPSDHPGMTTTGFVEVVRKRSSLLTIFWHCGFTHFSSRTGLGARPRQQTVNGFGRGSGSKGSGNADSQLLVRSSGWSGQCRPPGDSGCVAAHPAYRRAASYLPLRAGWAVCAWALRGCFEIARPFRAQTIADH